MKSFIAVFSAWMILLPFDASAQEPKPGEQQDCIFKYKDGDQEKQLRYDLFVPQNYNEKKSFPLMLFLHGAGERGDDLKQVRKWGPPKIVGQKKDFPFVVISPQCPRNDWWTSRTEGLAKLVDQVAGKLKIDKSRMYCTGLSMGGYGTWSLCAKHPKLFAAAAPICGGGNVDSAQSLIDMPIWAFHGGADRVVSVEKSKEMVEAIKNAGGEKVKLTIYEGVNHNSWSKAYASDELYQWLLSHQRPKAPKK